MKNIRIRKNFLLDRDAVEKAQPIIKARYNSLTEGIRLYLQAVVRNPDILDAIEQSANMRTGAFIGMLDGAIGDAECEDEMRTGAFIGMLDGAIGDGKCEDKEEWE